MFRLALMLSRYQTNHQNAREVLEGRVLLWVSEQENYWCKIKQFNCIRYN